MKWNVQKNRSNDFALLDYFYLPFNSFLDEGLWDEIRVETNTQLFIEEGVIAPTAHGEIIKKELIGHQQITTYRNSVTTTS